MKTEADAQKVPFFSDAVYGRKVKRRYVVWLLMVATGAGYLWATDPQGALSVTRLISVSIAWGVIVFVGGWLYDWLWKGKSGRLEIETRWLVWWFIVLWQSLLDDVATWAASAIFYGIIILLVGGLIDADRKRNNKRRLFANSNGMVARLRTPPHEAHQFSIGEKLKHKGEVLIVTGVGFDYVNAMSPGNSSQPDSHSAQD